MSRKLTLRIKSPCQENWNSFPKKGDTGFCSQCQKSVIDFTGKSDLEIVKIVAESHGRICGRVKSSQLRTYTLQNGSTSLDKAAIFSAVMLSLNPVVDAMANPWIGKPTMEQVPVSTDQETLSGPSSEPVLEWFTIKGRVVAAEDGSNLPGVNVIIVGSSYATVTDSIGNFLIEYPGEIGKEVTLRFAFIGFETVDKRIKIGNEDELEVFMLWSDVRMGDFVVSPWWTPRSIWWSVKGVFQRD